MATEVTMFDDENLDQELENILNHPAPAYNERSYWDIRYEKEQEPFEWYQPFHSLKTSMDKYLPGSGNALVLGCGNSLMSSELLSEGFDKVVSIDFSDVVISQMKKKYQGEAKLDWEVGDISKMKFSNNSFDFVFDKATLDTVICGDNSNKTVSSMLKEVCRVLKPGGIFVLISYGTPATRKRFFEGNQLNIIDTIKVEKQGIQNAYHYIYIIKKNE
jgi:ubiquinone/menaquinone biosynthesis C-methylase UbiE